MNNNIYHLWFAECQICREIVCGKNKDDAIDEAHIHLGSCETLDGSDMPEESPFIIFNAVVNVNKATVEKYDAS